MGLLDFFKGTGFGQVLLASSKFLPKNDNSSISNTKKNLNLSEVNYAAKKHIFISNVTFKYRSFCSNEIK